MLNELGDLIGPVSGVAALLWHVRNWWFDAPDLRLMGGTVQEIMGDPAIVMTENGPWPSASRMIFEITLANHGHQEIHVQGIGGTTVNGEAFELGDGFPLGPRPDALPCSLKAGQSTKVELVLSLLLDGSMLPDPRLEVARLCAIDGRQRKWRLPRKDFHRLQVVARATMESKLGDARAKQLRQRADSGLTEVAAENLKVSTWPKE